MAVNEKMLKKIQGLLETTVENGASAEESQSAIMMAQRLMAKYNIEMRDIEVAGEGVSVEPITGDALTSKKLNWWEKVLSVVVAENFRCMSYTRSNGSTRSVVFLGEPNDVEIAKSVYNFALTQLEHYAKQYRRKRRAAYKKEFGTTAGFDGTAIRNDYMDGYISGLKSKLREQLDENEDYALVVQTPDSVVKAFDAMQFRTDRVGARGAGDAEAKATGYKQGKQFASPVGSIGQ